MNGVYVTYVGFKLFQFPWYMYGYVVVDFLKHFVKGVMPEWLYMKFHRKLLGLGKGVLCNDQKL